MNYKHFCVIDHTGYYKTLVLVLYVIDTEGIIKKTVQSYTLQDGETLLETVAPSGFVRPRWDGAAWVEGATPEEIAAWEKEHPAPPPPPPSPIELLAAENHLLKAQMQAQSGRNDFIEDCIAEMAMQIYNT